MCGAQGCMPIGYVGANSGAAPIPSAAMRARRWKGAAGVGGRSSGGFLIHGGREAYQPMREKSRNLASPKPDTILEIWAHDNHTVK